MVAGPFSGRTVSGRASERSLHRLASRTQVSRSVRPPRRSTNVIRPFFEPWLAVDEHWVACCTVYFENFEECYSVGFKLGLHRLFFATLGCSGALSGSGREEEMK